MLQHYVNFRDNTDGLARARIHRSNASKMPLPSYPSVRDPSKFYPYKRQMLAAFDALELTTVANGTLQRDGPNPAPGAVLHGHNQALFDMSNSTLYNLSVRTFTADSLGHADAVSIPDNQGRLLWQHLVTLNESLMDTKIDDTHDKYNRSQQGPSETPRQFIARVQVLRTSLITGNIQISERNLNKVILRGLILTAMQRAILQVYTHQAHTAFLLGLEDQMDLDELSALTAAPTTFTPPQSTTHPSNKRTAAAISTDSYDDVTCHNCEGPGHYANQCPLPYNETIRQRFSRGGGKRGGGRFAGRGGRFGGRNNFVGRGGRGNQDALRTALNAFVSTLATPNPVPTAPVAPVAQPPPPATTAQALDTLLNAFFNCAIYTPAHAEFILATIAKEQINDAIEMIYWLFDTACGNHLTFSLEVFSDGPRTLTDHMRTADGSPILSSNIQVWFQ